MEKVDAKIHSVKLKLKYLKDALIEFDSLDLIEKNVYKFCFIVDFPMYELSDEGKIDFIEEVHINYNTKQVEIISEKELTDSEVSLVINTVLSLSHCHKHTEAEEITEEFNFENIDCPNCAMKVEDALNKQDDIIDAKVSFMNKKIIIKHKDNVEVFETVSKVLSDIETEAYLVDEHHHHSHDHHECSCNHHHHHHHDNEKLNFLDNIFKVTTDAKLNIVLGIIGIIIFIVGVTLKILKLYPEYLLYLFVTSYVLVAFSLIFKTIKSVIKGKLFNEDVLMLVASTGAMVVGEPIEAVMIVVLSRIGEMLQARAVRKSKREKISKQYLLIFFIVIYL